MKNKKGAASVVGNDTFFKEVSIKTRKAFMFAVVLLIAGSISAYAEGALEKTAQDVIDVMREVSGTNAPSGDTPVPSGGPTTWKAVSNSRFGTSDIRAVAYGSAGNAGNRFVAVGQDGKIAYSADGVTWTAVSNSRFGTSDICAVAYGSAGNRFVAVGQDGKMAYSADGATWTAVSNSTFGDSWINAIAYGGNRFVAVGQDGKMAYSSDGVTWTALSNGPAGGSEAIAYGGNRFVAMNYDSSGNEIFLYSTDGARWTAVRNSIVDFDRTGVAIAYGDNKFVAGGWNGAMAYSTNGQSWTAATDKPKFAAVCGIAYGVNAEGNGRFVAVGWGGGEFEFGGAMAYSTDGSRWTAITDSPFNRPFSGVTAIAYGNGRFVAVGGGGRIAYADW